MRKVQFTLCFIVLLLAGLYIHSVLLASGIIGLILLEGFGILPGLLGNEPFNRVASYTLTTIPLFVLMAQFILQSGLVQDIFYMVHKVSKGKNSLLGVLTLIIGGLLGAVSGSGTATSASLGQVAIPELRKHGYSAPLAGAVAASGGSLSGEIPNESRGLKQVPLAINTSPIPPSFRNCMACITLLMERF